MKNVDTIQEQKARFSVSFSPPGGEGGEKTAMPRGMKSEKGIVLVVVLVLSAVVLAVMTALIYMITSGTQMSGMQKRYRTALEAAKGGSDLFYQVIGSRGDTSTLSSVSPSILNASTCTGTDIYTGATYTGFQAKLKTPSTTWSAGCNSTLNINLNDSTPAPYDLKLVIGTSPQYNYYAKIVGTIPGNSAAVGSDTLYTGSVMTGFSGVGAIPVVSKPYLYAIEVDSESSSNPAERAKLSILYQY
jgi:hypothetical protein